MTEFNLEANLRETNGKKTRNSGKIPAVIYGNNVKNQSIAVNRLEFNRLFREAGTSNLIDVKVGDDKSIKTLIRDLQLNPVTLEPVHIDFYKVNMKEKIEAEVPLVIVGESRAVIDLEGTLITPKDSVQVECLPGDLIPEIEVDISVIDDFEKDIRVSDLTVPAGVVILDDPEEIIVHIEPPRSEAELEALDEAVVEDVSAVEVEAKAEEETAEGAKENE